jgi:hypothetical protein
LDADPLRPQWVITAYVEAHAGYNQNARRHGLFTGDAIAERRQIQALLGEARRLLEEMK